MIWLPYNISLEDSHAHWQRSVSNAIDLQTLSSGSKRHKKAIVSGFRPRPSSEIIMPHSNKGTKVQTDRTMDDGYGTEVARMVVYRQIDHDYHHATQMQWIRRLARLVKLQPSQKKKGTERKAAVINAETKDIWPGIAPKKSQMLGQLRRRATTARQLK